ncbi:MAG: RNA polymerase sigma factor [Faecousia sp.]
MILYMALIDEPKHIPLFEEIYYRYRAAMFGIAVAVLRDHHLAEDAVSEAFIKIAKNMGKLSALSSQDRKDYIVILTRNSAVDLYRQRRKQERVVDFAEDLADPGDGYTIDETLFGQEGYDRLVQAIHTLPDIYRDTMKLYYLYDHSAAEVAEIMGVKEDAVFARLSRGRKKLAAILAEEKEGSTP